MHPTSLNEHHNLTVARDINLNDLNGHLILEHGVSTKHVMTKAEYGRLHLLAHAVVAYPELRGLLNLPPEWGK